MGNIQLEAVDLIERRHFVTRTSGQQLAIAQRTCPKCGKVSETSDSICPIDGEALTDFEQQKSLERTIPTGTFKAATEPEAKPEKPYVSTDKPERSKRVNERHDKLEIPDGQPSAEDIKTAREEVLHSLVGTVLDNQYQIMSVIGQGGMSVVYKARHNMLRKVVAIKTMLPHLVKHPMSIQRFQQEAQAASNIVHTNVITIYNFGITPEGQPYLVMDYLEGKSLADVITQVKFLPVERATNIFLQVVNALAHAHTKGVIHRDLKPSNVILIQQGEKKDVVQIVDFGIAKMLPQEGEEAVNLTQTGEVFGSPLYMSPEQCKGEKLDLRADIYSMGCLMYETLTGKPPLYGDNTLEVLYRHINEMPQAMSSKEHPISARLEAIVFKALAKLPADRYQSMDDLEKDLNSFQKSQQFSLVSFFKSRWELSRLKRLPQTKREKAQAAAVSWILVAMVALALYPVVKFWNMANDPVIHAQLLLDDDRRPARQGRDELDEKALEMAIAQARDYLSAPTSSESSSLLLGALMRQGKFHADLGQYVHAYEAFDEAQKFSAKINGATAFPTLHALIALGDVEYNLGWWEKAVGSYNEFMAALKDATREGERRAFYSARIANCYWNMQEFKKSDLFYKVAVTIWSNPYAVSSGIGMRSTYAVTKEDTFADALARTRWAMIYQRELENKKVAELLPDDYKNAIAQNSASLLYTALPLWREVLGEDSKNEGICELQLAEVLEQFPNVKLNASSAKNGANLTTPDDKDVLMLLENGTAALSKSCGQRNPYYAIGLLRLADYWWRHHDYGKALSDRYKACAALSSMDTNGGQATQGQSEEKSEPNSKSKLEKKR